MHTLISMHSTPSLPTRRASEGLIVPQRCHPAQSKLHRVVHESVPQGHLTPCQPPCGLQAPSISWLAIRT
eukprot:5095522-Amphidinium_carterae.1